MNRQEQLKLAAALAKQAYELRRDSEPADPENWVAVGDMDTNKLYWYPRKLYDEAQNLRFSA